MARQNGSVIMVIVVLLAVIASLASVYTSITVSTNKSSLSIMSQGMAYDLARSGIEQGSYNLSLGTCNAGWSATVAVTGSGEYQYNCTSFTATSTLSSAINSSVTSIPLNSAAGFASFGSITINSETIYYNGIAGNTLLNARRGQNGSTAAAQILGSTVGQSQYVIGGRGGAPSLAGAEGHVTLAQAVNLTSSVNYIVVGSNGTAGVILNYNGIAWTTTLTAPIGRTFFGVYTVPSYGLAVGYTTNTSSSQTLSFIYQFNGTAWSFLSQTPTNVSRYNRVACDGPLNPAVCWVGGQRITNSRGILVRVGGNEYQAPNTPRNFMMTGVSCTGGQCRAVGNRHLYTFNSTSTSPMSSDSIGPNGQLYEDVHCPLSNRCVAVRENNVLYFTGGSWSAAFAVAPGSATITSVHCPTSTRCTLVATGGRAYTCNLPITGSGSCSLQTTPGTANLVNVYCDSDSDCLAVGGNVAYRFSGGAWTNVTTPGGHTLNRISSIPGSNSTLFPTVLINQ